MPCSELLGSILFFSSRATDHPNASVTAAAIHRQHIIVPAVAKFLRLQIIIVILLFPKGAVPACGGRWTVPSRCAILVVMDTQRSTFVFPFASHTPPHAYNQPYDSVRLLYIYVYTVLTHSLDQRE